MELKLFINNCINVDNYKMLNLNNKYYFLNYNHD